MACARFKDEKPLLAMRNQHQHESIGNFKLSFESLNDNGQSSIAIIPLRFSKLDPSNSPVRVVAWFWSATLNKNADEGSATGIRSLDSRRNGDL
jgi:hypothetical protein